MTGIVDYGVGNLRSAQKALEYLGEEAVVTQNPETLRSCDHVILPGVGAFKQAMDRLNSSGLREAVMECARDGRPLLGICLGMQMMFEESMENGCHQGLGLFPGRIERIQAPGLKIPHMGWNTLDTRPCALFSGGKHPDVYFVHSYCAPEVNAYTRATCWYGEVFTAVCQKGNVVAAQFHPEKSGREGLEMLRRFVAWKGEDIC